MRVVPSDDIDFYSDEVIRNPWPHYVRLRQLGPVVWLERHQNFALVRYDAVLNALRNEADFISGRGVAADEVANGLTRGNSAGSDGERHHAIRQATSAPLLPGALARIRPLIDEAATALIQRLIRGSRFDAISDLATHLPLAIVRDLVGLPDFGRENMLRWANATFDLLGIQNERGRRAVEVFLEQRRFAQTQTPDMLKAGSWTKRLFDLVEQGLLAPDLAPVAMRDYLNPSLDTTISATGQLIWRLGSHPDQWELLRNRPELVRNAANEAVRMASPVRSFVRHAARDVDVEGYRIPAGSRIMMVFASANRDERTFERPDTFDVTRNPRHHVGFGSGIHMCVGMHLAQMEMIALLEAMIPMVERIEVGEGIIALNNTIYGFSSLPARFVPAAQASTRPVAAAVCPDLAPKLLRGRIVSRERIATDIVALTVEPVNEDVFPDWTAGAHIDVHVMPGVVRQYSLSGRKQAGRYTFAVQRERASRGGSAAIHTGFELGAEIMLSTPRNHFPLDDGDGSALLFSGGIGVTPILAMAWELHEEGRDFIWHISARDRGRLAWADMLATFPFADRVHVHLSDDPSGARVDVASVVAATPPGSHLYVCGPSGYMDHVMQAAHSAGLAADHIHREHFGAEIDVNGDPFTIVAARSGMRISVAANETMLDAVTRAGFYVEYNCRNGVCGSCVTRVLAGRPDHRDMILTDAEKAENDRVALCCSRSQSAELVLDL